MHGRGHWRILLCLPRNSIHCRIHPEPREPSRCDSIRKPLPDRLGLHPRDCLRHHHLCTDFRRSLQPGYNDSVGVMAGLSVEESPLLYLQSDIWGLHGWTDTYGHVLARDSGYERGVPGCRKALGRQRSPSIYTLFVPQPQSDEPGLGGHDRVLRRLLHCDRDLVLFGSRKRECWCFLLFVYLPISPVSLTLHNPGG